MDMYNKLYIKTGNPPWYRNALNMQISVLQMEWDDTCIGDRINGILLQLISCLQNRRCPQYFLPSVDLFKGKSTAAMDSVAKQVWRIVRELLTNPHSLEVL